MPELPDVEGFRRFLADRAAGEVVQRVEVPDAELVRNSTPQGLGRALTGRRLDTPGRHGKWLVVSTDDGAGATLLLHFAMTGYLSYEPHGADRHAHDRVVLVLEDGELRFNQMRRLGGAWVVPAGDDLGTVTGHLGPDALDVGREQLGQLLTSRRGGLKSALMDQEVIAGLGNLLVDEILWQARLHPRRGAADLSDTEADRLHDRLREVLEVSVDHGRVPGLDDWLTGARGDDDPRCPRDGTALARSTVAGRTTRWCPVCQRDP